MQDIDWKLVAAQLRKPENEDGLATAARMEQNNGGMISESIKALQVQPKDNILELGFGNGAHIKQIMTTGEVLYTGVDISPTMVTLAGEINKAYIDAGAVNFAITDGLSLPYTDNSFHKIFTVNTLYFWEQPLDYAKEIYRVLQPGGKLCLCFADADFMEKLPFVQYGFTLYTLQQATDLLTAVGFINITPQFQHEELISPGAPNTVERDYIILHASK